MNPNSPHVIIIGAGTGGLSLTHGLRKAGIRVSVYERDRTRKDGLQGYRVGISPAGSAGLHECLPPHLFDTFVATCARSPRYFNMLTEQFAELLCIPVPEQEDPLQTEKSVSRMTLRQVLLTDLEEVVTFDKKFARYDSLPDGRVEVFFEDGTSVTGDLLVGADGAGSRVRKQFLPHAKMEETGIVSIGGKVALTPETKALLSAEVFYGVSLVTAPRGFGGIIHVMEFKWDRSGVKGGIGDSDAMLIAQWPGLLFDNTVDYINWGIWAARDKFPDDLLSRKGESLLAAAADATRRWHPHFRRLVELTDPLSTFAINIRTSLPVAPWPSGNVTLLGDAIHTMTPGRGVGANTAIRDAALLTRRLREARDGLKTMPEALHEYEAEMLRYSAEAVAESRQRMDGRSLIHKPFIGRIQLALSRTAMRIVNRVPALKRRMVQSLLRLRKNPSAESQPALTLQTTK